MQFVLESFLKSIAAFYVIHFKMALKVFFADWVLKLTV